MWLENSKDGGFFANRLHLEVENRRLSDVKWIFTRLDTCKLSLKLQKNYTGRFIMFSLITNIYNKKTKGPNLVELFTATAKLKNSFLTTGDIWCVHHGWHGTHLYDIQVLATHTRQHGCFLLAQTPNYSKLFILRTNGLVFSRVLCILLFEMYVAQ